MFPEIFETGSKVQYGDWTLAADTDRPLIKVKAKAPSVADFTLTTMKSPGAESTLKVTVGAQALAASIMATAAIASTLF